jgi:hypothetical protein
MLVSWNSPGEFKTEPLYRLIFPSYFDTVHKAIIVVRREAIDCEMEFWTEEAVCCWFQVRVAGSK